jgi:hypothetical protein
MSGFWTEFRSLTDWTLMRLGSCCSKLLAAGLSFQALHAGEWTPVQHSLERYEHIWKSSPFIAATEVTPQAESLAQRYAVTGFARIGDADVVFLFDRKSLSRLSVGTGSPAQGVELLEVMEAGDMASLRARIRVGGQVSEIGYDAGAGSGDAVGKTPSVPQGGPTSPLPPPIAPPPQVAPNVAPVAQKAPQTGKPVKIIRRKQIDAP